jgi:hypothetical protein
MYAPHVDPPCEEFLDRRQYSAVAQIPRVKRQARSVGRDALCGADRRACISGAAHAALYVFVMRCSARRHPWAVRRFCDAGRATATPPPTRSCDNRLGGRDTPGSKAADRTLASIWARRAARGPGLKFPVRWRQVVEPALYPVEGRQTGDLRQKCGGALIRKAKLPSRSCGRFVPFGRDGRKGALSVRRGEGSGSWGGS